MKFALPKFKSPKFGQPKIAALKMPRPKFGMPKLALSHLSPKSRIMVMGASALALIGAGGLAWFLVRPMLAPPKASEQNVAAAPSATAQDRAAPSPAPISDASDARSEKKTETPRKDQTAAEPADAAKTDEKAEAAPEKPEAKPEKAGEAAQVAAVPPSQAPAGEPEILIRRLQDLQERVAAGDAASYVEQPRLLRLIARRFAAQPAEVWAAPQNARALILYLLSGGSSAVGRKVLGQRQFAAAQEPLAKGAIAYLESVEGADRDNLLALDPRALDPALGAQLAFVQSILLTGLDRPRATEKLDLARLLAPGGLVEEAALRREVGLLSETVEFDKFAALARQYWQRFRASPYSENFLRQFLVSLARVSQRIKVAEWAQLEEFINSLAPETRRSLYLVMAQSAAVAGNVGLADMAARRALTLCAAESGDLQRARLYRAASNIAQAPTLLGEVEKAKLPAGDQPLYDAVHLVAARIFRTPETNFAATPPATANELDAMLALATRRVRAADDAVESVRVTMQRKSR